MKGCGRSGAVILDALTSLASFNVFAYVVAQRGPEIVTTDELVRLPASRVSGGDCVMTGLDDCQPLKGARLITGELVVKAGVVHAGLGE